MDSSLALFSQLLPEWFTAPATVDGAPVEPPCKKCGRSVHAPLSNSSITLLRRLNSLDTELYAFAQERFKRQALACGV